MFRQSPGFLDRLQTQLMSLPFSTLEHVNREGGLEVADLLTLVVRPRDHSVPYPDPVEPDVVEKYDDVSDERRDLGSRAYATGEAAFCILAGGSGTRFGETKALARLPQSDKSLLQLKLEQAAGAQHVWVMTSPSNHEAVVDHVKTLPGADRVKF
jgi:hypothetical protein